MPEDLPDITYFANQDGELLPLIAGNNMGVVVDFPFLLGVKFHGNLHPIFDHGRRWIMVNLRGSQIIPVTVNLYRTYSRFFPAHILARLHNINGELVMPPNGLHIEPSNERRRHN